MTRNVLLFGSIAVACGSLTLAAPQQAAAPAAQLSTAEQAAALITVREYALSYTRSLPNYTCIQSTRQTMTRPAAMLGGPPGYPVHVDVIEEQLSFSDRREIHTVTKINNGPPSGAERAHLGARSSGEFGSLLYTIFDPRTGADIHWDRVATLEGRRVDVFAFHVPQPTGYTLVESGKEIRVPFEGFVFADVQTGTVLRIETKCTGIPARSEYLAVNLTLDYKAATIAGRKYILPSHYFLRYEMVEGGTIIDADYKSYRRFSAESRLEFDGDASPAPEPAGIGATIVENKESAPEPQPVAEPAEAKVAIPESPQPRATTPPEAAAAPDPVFHSTTRLVQVSVIAEDKHGKRLPNLRREDFQILDNGSPREIQLFVAETKQATPPNPETVSAGKAPGTFTNQIGSPKNSHSGYSVVLIDNLFTPFGDPAKETGGSGLARVQALKMLRSIPDGERIAIYAIGRKLRVIADFTADRDLLERRLKMWTPTLDADETDVGDAKEREEFARIEALQKIPANNEEMDLLAEHLASIPGRKNLIWLSIRFVIGSRSLGKFTNAGVSIYPVDLDGVCAPPLVPCTWPRPTALMDGIAAQTGGLAYYHRNDIDSAIREAMDDERVSYTLGFYASSDVSASDVHQITVSVDSRDIRLRYQRVYLDYGRQTEDPQQAAPVTNADLAKTLNGLFDVSAIPITASLTRTEDRLKLEAMLDVESLELATDHDRRIGKIEVVARFTTADGISAGDMVSQTMTLNLRRGSYETAMRRGLPYRTELKIPAKARVLKLLVANPAAGKTGTLTIPLSEVGLGKTEAK